MSQKYHILTLGCQMNKSDSERIARVLEDLNYTKADNEKSADLIVINSCSVRQPAINRIYGKARVWNKEKIRRQKEDEHPLITILTGCVLPNDKKKIAKLFNLVLDIKELPKLSEMISRFKIKDLKLKNNNNQQSTISNYFNIKPIYRNPWSAFVPIMTGCNNFCTYCAVPHTRGREIIRSVKEILEEVNGLVNNGCLEITLLGQNVNTYRPEKLRVKSEKLKNNPYSDNFAMLLWELNQFDKLNRIHFTAAHPKDMSDEVIDALTLPKMVNFLHLPVQSGDDEILKAMNRHYVADDYIKLIKKIRNKKPNIALATDIIVGFPGETKEQFENTVKLYQKAQFDISYTAKYSSRPGTAAAKLEDDVVFEEKKRRWEELHKLMQEITLEKNQKYLGQTVEVLVDKVVGAGNVETRHCLISTVSKLYEGNSREYKRVRLSSKEDLLGKVVNVKIDKVLMWVLEGEMV